jgi:hypothetical protein
MKKQLTLLMVDSFVSGAILLGAANAFAEAHPPGKFTGQEIELFENGHSFAGKILDIPYFGIFDEGTFTAKVQFRRNGITSEFVLGDIAGKYIGTITEVQVDSASGHSKTVVTQIEYSKVAKTGAAQGEVTLLIDGAPLAISVQGKSFSNSHFQEPRFSAVLSGKTVEFEFTGGACFKYSVNISMMILGVYAHLIK